MPSVEVSVEDNVTNINDLDFFKKGKIKVLSFDLVWMPKCGLVFACLVN